MSRILPLPIVLALGLFAVGVLAPHPLHGVGPGPDASALASRARLVKERDAAGRAVHAVALPDGTRLPLGEWRRRVEQLAPRVGPDLAAALGNPSDLSARADSEDRLRVLVWLHEQPADDVALAVGDRFAPELDELRRELRDVRFLESDGGARPVRSREEERARSTVFATPGPRERALLDAIDALAARRREAIASELARRSGPALERLADEVARLGGTAGIRLAVPAGLAARLPAARAAAIVEELAASPAVALVELDGISSSVLDVSGEAMGADVWWSAGRDGGTFDVAIADSGVDDTHPGFAGSTIVHGKFLDTAGNPPEDPTADDVNGHGSHVAGITGSTDATRRGVAHGLDVLFNVKAGFDLDGADGGGASMYHSDGMAGVHWAVTYSGDGADVVNLSYGGTASSDDSGYVRFWDAIVQTYGVGATISAGNSGPGAGTVGRPGIAPNVLCVANLHDRGTVDRSDDVIRSSSSRGPTPGGRRKPDIAAPGTLITSCNNDWESAADWVGMTGTSMAAPQVAGALLLLADGGNVDPIAQKAVLLNTAEDLGTEGWDAAYGFGAIDLAHAYEHRDDVFTGSIAAQPDFRLFAGPALEGDTATLVWNRRAIAGGAYYPVQWFALTDLDLYLYDGDLGSVLDSDTTVVDNVQQVRAPGDGDVVLRVDCASANLAGASVEPFALATEEGFALVDPDSVTVAIEAPATVPPGGSFTVKATVTNPTAARFFGGSVTLVLPAGFSLGAGGSVTHALGSLGVGSQTRVSWLVDAPQAAADRDFEVDLAFAGYGESFAASDAGSIDFAGSLEGADGIGIHHGTTATFFLVNEPGPGFADAAFRFGASSMIPLAGDWDGDGVDTVGLYLASTGTFFLRNSNDKGVADLTYRFGPPDRLPIVGDWDGDGTDTVGIYDAATGSFFLRDDHGAGPASAAFRFGPAGMLPVVGDWDGDGTDTIGIYAGGTRSFFLRDANSRGIADYTFKFGSSGSLPLSGDWDGDGVDTVGTYRTSAREFSLADENVHGAGANTFRFGGGGVRPIAGDWDDA